MKVTRATIALAALVVVLALMLAFQLGRGGGSHVDARDCGQVEQSGWHFKSC